MKAFKKPLLTFILGILVTCITGVFAYSYVADQISYTTDKNENIKNVEQALNDLYSIASNKGSGYIIENNESNVFSSLTCTAVDNKIDIDVTINPAFKNGYSDSDIYIYLVMVDDKVYEKTTSSSIKIKNYTASKIYNIKAIAIDKDGKLHKGAVLEYTAPDLHYEKSALAYPLITGTGVKNVKYIAYPDTSKSYYEYDNSVNVTASDAMPKAAYDGNASTGVGPYNATRKYLNIDPSAYGKTITITTAAKYWGYKFLTAKDADNYCQADSRSSSLTFTIPSGQTWLKLYGNENQYFYEIKVN